MKKLYMPFCNKRSSTHSDFSDAANWCRFIKWGFVSVFMFFSVTQGVSQTGPGGVGNADGTDQPRNILWLDANNFGLSNGDNVTSWTDRSGNGFNATANIGNEPEFVANLIGGKPAVQFTSGNLDYLTLNSQLANNTDGLRSTNYTVFVVGRRKANAVNYMIGCSGSNLLLGWNTNTANFRYFHRNTQQNMTASTSVNSFGIFSAKYLNNSTPGVNDLYVGENGSAYNSTANQNGYITADESYYLGATSSTLSYFDVDIAEVIFYRSAINDAQRIIVENYLSQKYGVAVANDFYSNAAGYDIDLIGVGQTIGGSHTLASANGLYISIVSGLGNGEFVFAAHNGVENEPVITDLPSGVSQRYSRDWYFDKTGDFSVKITFDFPEAMQGAKNPQVTDNYRLLYRSGTTGNYSVVSNASLVVSDADQVAFNVLNADLNDGYYTLGTVNATESPVSGKDGTTWYAYRSGNWNDATIWTLDPAAALYVNPSPAKYPNLATDNVVIPDGKNVVVTHNNIACNNLTVYGRLDLATTTGHSFSSINGTGRMLLAADNFPTGDATHFITKGQGQGTVVYYGNSFSLTNNRTFYNMEVAMTGGNILSMRSNITLNGNLNIESGTLRFSDNTSTASRTLTVNGDVLVNSSTASISVYNQNASHTFNVYGNITNKGTIQLTNLAVPTYSSTPPSGYVVLNILGESNTTLEATGPTNLQRLILNKGNDATYTFTVNPTDKSYFRLYGQNNNDVESKALYIQNGTLELAGSTYIHSLTEETDFEIPVTGGLWINGAGVLVQSTARDNNADGFTSVGVKTTNDGAQSFTVLGNFKITDGVLNTNSHGFVVWDEGNAYVQIDGGTVNTPGFRSAGANTGKWTYQQTGGTVNMYGDYLSDLSGSGSATFEVKGVNNTFIMSGGIMVINDAATPSNLAINIESGEGNYSVTGGTVRINRDANGSADFNISSTAPFYNFEVLSAGSSYPSTAKLNTNLTVNGDLLIGDYATLDASSSANTLSVAGNFTIGTINSVYTHRNNTTRFIGAKNSVILVNNTATASYLKFHNLTLEKDIHPTSGSRYQVAIGATNTGRNLTPSATSDSEANTVITIGNQLSLIRGNLIINRYTVNLMGNGYVVDGYVSRTTSGPGRLALTGSSAQTLTASTNYTNSFGRLELYNTNGVSLGSDVAIDELIMERDAVLDIKDYKLSIGAGGIIKTTGSFGTSRMFQTDGSAGARGVKLDVTLAATNYAANQVLITVPVGVSGRYSPFEVKANAAFTLASAVTGTINVVPVNTYHPAASSTSNVLAYYWRVTTTGFDNNVRTNTKTSAYYNGPIDSNTATTQLLYNNDWLSGLGSVSTTTGQCDYNAPGLHSQADFTAGSNGRFTQPRVLYSIKSGVYNAKETWSETSHTGAATNQPPRDFDVVVIGGTSIRNDSVYISSNNTRAARVIINASLSSGPDADGHSYPVLDIASTTGHTFNVVEGGGKFKRSNSTSLSGDWDGFLKNSTAIFEYYGGTYALPSNFTYYPTLLLSGSSVADIRTLPSVNLTIYKDLKIESNTTLISSSSSGDLKINGDLTLTDQAILRFGLTNNRSVEVVGSILMPLAAKADNCTIETTNSNGSVTHNLYVGKDIQVGTSTLTLYRPSRPGVVNLTFNGGNTSTFNSEMLPSINAMLNRVIVNKTGNTTAVKLYGGTINAVASGNSDTKPLYLIKGSTTVYNNALVLSSGGGTFNIPSTATLTVQNATVSLTGNTGVWLDGRLIINAGGIANLNGGTNNYIEYTASNASRIDVNSTGILRVGSQIRRSLNTVAGNLKFYQTSSTSVVEIGMQAAPESSRGVFEILNTGSFLSQATNAVIKIKKHQAGSTFPDLYLDPASISLGTGSAISIEGGTSTDAFEIYSTKPLRNLNVNGSAVVKLKTLPLTLSGNLTISAGTKFDANGLDLTLNGNMTNSGTFTPNGNTTYFSGSSAQTITGNVSFFNFSKTATNTVSLASGSAMVVDGMFRIESGTFNDGNNNVSLKGNVYNAGTTVSTSSDGLVLNGTSEQTFDGSGTYGRLTINNLNGIRNATDGLTLTVSQELRMRKGVLAIGRNLLVIQKNATITEVAPYSETNMVSTNTSFTDAGILRYFPSGSRTLVYPIGADNKYTPVTFSITNNTSEAGHIRVKAANEPHLTILTANKNSVLQYNWTFDAGNLSDFSATATLKCYAEDIKPNSAAGANYITARLQNDGSGIWYKYSKDDFNELTNELSFYFSDVSNVAITGDYTAGLDAAIPSTVPKYRSVNNGDWTVGANWINEADNLPAPDGGPSGCIVNVNHAINMNANFIAAYTTSIASTATLTVNSGTYGHRLGAITGTGKMKLFSGDMPAADYTQFVAPGTGTFEFAGSSDYDVLSSFGSVNNLVFSGTGLRRLPNLNLTVNGNLLIEGATLKNEHSKIQYVQGNMQLTSGSFVPGTANASTCYIMLNGSKSQYIGGFVGSSSFAMLRVNNSKGIVLAAPVEVNNTLYLTNGVVNTNSSAKLYVSRPATGAVSGTSSSSYVDGPFVRNTTATGYTFNVGSNGRQALTTVSPITGSTGDWEVQYKNEATPLTEMISPVQYVSNNEYWSIQAPSINKTASITVRSDASSGVNPLNADDLLVFYRETPLGWTDLGATLSGDISSGSATKASVVFDGFSGLGRITFGSKTNDVFDWIGTSSIDWFDGTNWSKGVVPSAASPVVINNTTNKPVINNSSSVAYAKTLEIKSSATLSLKPASKLSVYGNITNNGQLILEHTTESPSSFIYNGTGSVPNVKVSRTFNGESLRKWYVGHVITESTYANYIANVAAPVTSNFAMAFYNTPGWSNVTGGNVGIPMKGYGVQFRNIPGIVEHTGSLFANTDRSVTLVKAGYHLVSNPYPSYLDLSSYLTQWDFASLDKSVWVFTGHGVDRKFVAYNLATGISTPVGVMDKYIAPLQGFFVSAPSANANFTIRTGAKAHGEGGALKSSATTGNDILRVSLVNSTSSDETVVVFREIGSSSYSGQLDSKKFTDANASIPFVYSIKDNVQVAINLMPEDPTTYIIPLGMSVGDSGAGDITLKATNIASFLPDMDVFLLDKVTGETINLREKPEYRFTTAAVTNQNRFELSFKAIEKTPEVVTGVDRNEATNIGITAIGIGTKAIVKVKDAAFAGKVSIEVVDALGKVHQQIVSNTDRTELEAPANTQFYVVKVTYKGVVKSFKIMNVSMN